MMMMMMMMTFGSSPAAQCDPYYGSVQSHLKLKQNCDPVLNALGPSLSFCQLLTKPPYLLPRCHNPLRIVPYAPTKPLTCPQGQSAWAVALSLFGEEKPAQCKKLGTRWSAQISCHLKLSGIASVLGRNCVSLRKSVS